MITKVCHVEIVFHDQNITNFERTRIRALMAQEGLPDAWTLWRIPSRALGQTHVPKFAGPGKFRMKGNFTREGPMRPVGFVWHEEMVNLRRSHKASGDASDRLTWDVAQQDGDVLPRDAWGAGDWNEDFGGDRNTDSGGDWNEVWGGDWNEVWGGDAWNEDWGGEWNGDWSQDCEDGTKMERKPKLVLPVRRCRRCLSQQRKHHGARSSNQTWPDPVIFRIFKYK